MVAGARRDNRLLGAKTGVVFAQSPWPRRGQTLSFRSFKNQRDDGYQFLHEQTLRLANQGDAPAETGERVRLPDEAKQWYRHDYYDTVNHSILMV